MTQITVDRTRPVGDLTQDVDRFFLLRYKLITFLHLAFLTVSLAAFAGLLFGLFAGPKSEFASALLNHLQTVFGTGGVSGGIGLWLKTLDQRDQEHLDRLQFMRMLQDLPDGKAKEQIIGSYFKKGAH